MPSKGRFGSQTLARGLDILEAAASGATTLPELQAAAKLNRSTTHRLATTLIARRYLVFVPHGGYGLGPKVLELGHQASAQLDISRVARNHLEKLAAETGDTVHLGILHGTRCLYLDKLPGRRRVEINSRVGELQPLRSTGLGKALILDADEGLLRKLYRCENDNEQRYGVPESKWISRMREHANCGYTFDKEETEDCIRCVAAPVRDATGNIQAALSVSSAAQYMDDERMQSLAETVLWAAEQISRELGWRGAAALDIRSKK